jgi:hypothetical protein
MLLMMFVSGVGYGFLAARALWSIAYLSGEMHANTELVLDTQEFAAAVEARKPFTRGDYTFVPSRNQPKTVKIHRTPKPMGGN